MRRDQGGEAGFLMTQRDAESTHIFSPRAIYKQKDLRLVRLIKRRIYCLRFKLWRVKQDAGLSHSGDPKQNNNEKGENIHVVKDKNILLGKLRTRLTTNMSYLIKQPALEERSIECNRQCFPHRSTVQQHRVIPAPRRGFGGFVATTHSSKTLAPKEESGLITSRSSGMRLIPQGEKCD